MSHENKNERPVVDMHGLREFALKIGAYCLPGEGYKAIFDCEFGDQKY